MGIQVRKRIIINIPFIGIKMAQILRAGGRRYLALRTIQSGVGTGMGMIPLGE